MKPRLLIVDDRGEIRRLIRLTFGLERHDIHEAADGIEALALAGSVRPNVVVLDVMMPGPLDGLAVCRRLKADSSLAATRVVLLSARGQRHDIETGLAAGADGYFVKPFSPIELLDHVEQLIPPGGAR